MNITPLEQIAYIRISASGRSGSGKALAVHRMKDAIETAESTVSRYIEGYFTDDGLQNIARELLTEATSKPGLRAVLIHCTNME